MIDKLKSLKDKADSSGLSETTLYVLECLASLKEELRNLIYARTNYLVIASKEYTTVGGSAVEEIEVEKACAGKQVHVTMAERGDTPVTILSAKCSNSKITVTFSADPGNDHIIHYTIVN